jgi:DNA modification methylase
MSTRCNEEQKRKMRSPTPQGIPVADDLPGTRDLSGEFRKYIGKQVSYATHGIHRYPAKFIPQIPRFCIESYSNRGETILDPFMGSGTTLLEAFICGRDSCGIDVHPLARLIAKVKTTPLEPGNLSELAETLLEDIRADADDCAQWVPEIPNREHWFRPSVLADLARVKKHVWALRAGPTQDFFKICLSSIVRKVSNSDDDSLIPEVTSFQKKLDEQGKTSYDAIGRFENTVRAKLIDAADFWRLSGEVVERFGRSPKMQIIGRDARDIALDDGKVDLAVTSPPYASAVHYVSVHKLEMYWLGLIHSTSEIDGRIVGTSRAYADEYRGWEPKATIAELRKVLGEMAAVDLKSAFIVHKYFDDMRKNLNEANRVLKKGGRYCLVVGENTFRKVRIPTYRILSKMAERTGFGLDGVFVYDVINRHLDIPRWNNSRIERDHILVLKRKRRSELAQV